MAFTTFHKHKCRIGLVVLMLTTTTTTRTTTTTTALAFTIPKASAKLKASRFSSNSWSSHRPLRNYHALDAASNDEQQLDELLEENKLGQAVGYIRSKPDMELTRERFGKIFDAIEEVTSEADLNSINLRREQEFSLLSESRKEMADMYQVLKDQGHLRLFGAVEKYTMPASGSHTVRPSMLEQITSLSMKNLTPRPSNTLLYAGAVTALLEAGISAYFGISLNFLFILTIVSFLVDRIFLNGALAETVLKVLSPETQPKITRHEAGHFLCAYLLGCPVEGYVLSAWAAMQDARFGSRAVSAGTSFFDAELSSQIASNKVPRSSIDRYSIIVMAGIAAEAVQYGQADGGAGDEMALIAFLTNLNGGPSPNPAWNDVTIRNQARWGALQAVLLIRQYKECYDALVDALERGGSLGDCIYAIEKAGRNSGLEPLKKPLGYILERSGGLEEQWVKDLPDSELSVATVSAAPTRKERDPDESIETLEVYKEELKRKLRDLDARLNEL